MLHSLKGLVLLLALGACTPSRIVAFDPVTGSQRNYSSYESRLVSGSPLIVRYQGQSFIHTWLNTCYRFGLYPEGEMLVVLMRRDGSGLETLFNDLPEVWRFSIRDILATSTPADVTNPRAAERFYDQVVKIDVYGNLRCRR